jgi:hypothetical protein
LRRQRRHQEAYRHHVEGPFVAGELRPLGVALAPDELISVAGQTGGERREGLGVADLLAQPEVGLGKVALERIERPIVRPDRLDGVATGLGPRLRYLPRPFVLRLRLRRASLEL